MTIIFLGDSVPLWRLLRLWRLFFSATSEQSWVECVCTLILRHSVQLSSAELNIPSLFNSAELNAWVVLSSLLSTLCWVLLRHSVQLSWTERVYSTQLNRGELNVCYSWVDPRLLATRSYSRLLRPSMTWSFIGDSGRLLIISIWLELVVYLGVVVY